MKRIKISSTQLKKILEFPDIKPKFPIIMDFTKITKVEAQEIIDLLKRKRA